MKSLFFISFLLFAGIANAKNYYISETGNDANNGLSSKAPWKTISKLNSSFALFQPGDSILFKRGETFIGTIIINKNDLNIGAYDNGNNPTITGFTTVTGWTNEGNGIYSKIITAEAQTNMVMIDGVQYGMGRYPDAGYLNYESFATNLSITDNGLGTTTNWTGAEAAIRKNDWTIDRCIITNHTGDVLTYTSKGTSSNGTANFGYFIQNDVRCLTTYGEWFHDATTGKFSMYFGLVDPNKKIVCVATLNRLVTNSGFDNLTISNINFTGAIDNTLQFTGATDNCDIQNCNFNFSGKTAIYFSAGTSSFIDNNTITNCNRSGISTDALNTIITNNTITNIGNVVGQSLDAGGYVGIYTPGNGVSIRYNKIRNIGYNGISLRYTGAATVQYNFIDSACTSLDDGGGIYTSSPNLIIRLIDHNIITNVIGNFNGTNHLTSRSAGIYLDEVSENVKISNNTTANISFAGIKLHKANNNTVTDNTFFNSNYCIELYNSSGTNIYGNAFKRNIAFAKTATQYALRIGSVVNNNSSFGTADSNYYTRPLNDNQTITTNQPSTGSVLRNLAGWQSFVSQDQNSRKSKIAITNINNIRFEYNATNTAQTIVLDAKYISVDSTIYNGSITLKPYSSAVLLKSGAVDAPIKADAGIDISLVLPINSTILKGSSTGTATTYNWTKLLGPNQYTIASPNSAITNVTNLATGKYTFQFKVTNSIGDTSTAIVHVTVAGVLPVKLIDFTATNNYEKISLKWSTNAEINFSHFEIERSSDGQVFERIGSVNSNNLADVQSNYGFNDLLPLQGNNFYRLAMVDKDGTTIYSKTVNASIKNSNSFALVNLAISSINQNLKIGLNSNYQQVLNISVVDVSGRIIMSAPVQLQKGFNVIDKRMPTVATGINYISLMANDQRLTKAVLTSL